MWHANEGFQENLHWLARPDFGWPKFVICRSSYRPQNSKIIRMTKCDFKVSFPTSGKTTPKGLESDSKVIYWARKVTLSLFWALTGSISQGGKSHFKVTFRSSPAPGAVVQRRLTNLNLFRTIEVMLLSLGAHTNCFCLLGLTRKGYIFPLWESELIGSGPSPINWV